MRAGTRYWTRPHGRPGRCRVGPAQAGRSQETRAAGGRSGAMTESHLSQEIDPDAAITEDNATNIESENGHLSHLDEGDGAGDDIAIVGAADTVEEVEGPPEVELLEARLVSGSGDPKHTLSSAKQIRESLAEAAVVGDLAALEARVDHLLGRAKQGLETAKVARDKARADAVARKQDLVGEAEK